MREALLAEIDESLYAESLGRLPESAAAARALVETALKAWGLSVLLDDAGLIVTELVSNAVNHAQHSNGLRVTVSRPADKRVRLGVIDEDRTRPSRRPVDVEQESGRGLLLVEVISIRWGVSALPGGKLVWAELEAA